MVASLLMPQFRHCETAVGNCPERSVSDPAADGLGCSTLNSILARRVIPRTLVVMVKEQATFISIDPAALVMN